MTTWERVDPSVLDDPDDAAVPTRDHHCAECCTADDCPRCWSGPDPE